MSTIGDAGELKKRFEEKLPQYKNLRDEVVYILETGLQDKQIKIHSLSSRIKEFPSFLKKAERKNLKDPLLEEHDIAGVRVVCLFLSDINRVGDLIRSSFHVLNEDNKIEGQELSSFGYLSLHFTINIKKSYSGARYDAIKNLPCEIQVRTIAMDAWATTSHYLDYKTEADVPRDLRRDFYALSGLFYVADRHFEVFFQAQTKARAQIAEIFDSAHPLDQEINLDSLDVYLQNKYPERNHLKHPSLSVLVQELARTGYVTLQQLDDVLRSVNDIFIEYEKAHPPGSKKDPRPRSKYAAEGVVRISLAIADEAFAKELYQDTSEFDPYRALLKRKSKG